MFNKLDAEGNKVFKYSGLALVQTKEGQSYFGMHNDDYLDCREGVLKLSAVKEIPTRTLNTVCGNVVSEFGRVVGIAGALSIPRTEILNAAFIGRGVGENFRDKEVVNIPLESVTRLDDLPDCHEQYHAWNVNLRERPIEPEELHVMGK